jgi:hypothetical protein
LRKDAKKYQAAGITEQVLLSFTSDPYHRGDTSVTRTTLKILIKRGLAICTLTKGGTRALRDLDLFRPKRDAFACTLTSLDDRFSKKWERNAALPGDRIKALRKFHDAGIFTWVSLEPTLDVKSSLALVEATHEFVDLFKVGRTNYLPKGPSTGRFSRLEAMPCPDPQARRDRADGPSAGPQGRRRRGVEAAGATLIYLPSANLRRICARRPSIRFYGSCVGSVTSLPTSARKNAGTSFAMPTMLEHDRNPL